MDYQFLWRPVWKSLPSLFEAMLVTLEVTIISMALGIVFALFVCAGKMSDSKPLRFIAGVWIEVARNTPALFQLFFFKFGLGALGIIIDSYVVVVIALTFNTAGYMAETFRGGYGAIPRTQLNASRSLGMTYLQTQLYVLIPQLIRIVYSPMTNQLIWVLLMSSLGMLVGLRELSGETQFLYSKTFRAFEYFTAAAILYYLMAKALLLLMRLIGRFALGIRGDI